ncbi:MAG: DUF3084 domain-containing protein [Armatimonadetes bacterium]|nr:DUF3084 domain-containing protein [Armatimonadota bacterium]
MDNVSLWFLVILVVLGGGVAALGDYLGRRLGKKRLRFVRMRPKHTAVVMTAVAGMLATFFTILILKSLSEPVKIWLEEGTQIQEKLRVAVAEMEAQQIELDRGEREIAAIRTELANERRLLAEEQAKVAEAGQLAVTLRQEAGDLRQQIESVSEQLSANTEQLEGLNAEYADLEAETVTLKGNIKTYSDQQIELSDTNYALIEQNAEFEIAIAGMEAQIQGLRKEIADTGQELETATQNFESERKRIEADRRQALREVSAAEADLAAARRMLRDLLEDYKDSLVARVSRLNFNQGDELSRLAVRSMLNQAEARSYLLAVMETASREAMARGASDSGPSGRAVGFASALANDSTPVTPEMQFQQGMAELMAKQFDQMVIVRSLFNSFLGEWVRIRVEVVPNPVVYEEGDLIIEARIDGRDGVQGVYEKLVPFMANELRDRALNDGMIPADGMPQPLGAISQEELQGIVTDIVEAGRVIRIRFHAQKQTRAGDRLTLDIRLR